MTDPRDWRDARFKKALDSAPDSAERPSDAVRETILAKVRATAAQAAAAKAAPPQKRSNNWWSLGLPWNSALGTVAVVCLVSVLWWREDLPKQAEEAATLPEKAQLRSDAASQAEALRRRQVAESEAKSVAAQRVAPPALAPAPAAAADKKVPVPKHIPPPVVRELEPYIPAPEVIVAAPAPAPIPAPMPPAKATVSAPSAVQGNVELFKPAPAPMLQRAPAPAAVAAPELFSRASEPLQTVTVTGARIALVAWTGLRVRTPSGPVLLANDEVSASGQILLQQQLRQQRMDRELRYAADRSSAPMAVATSQPPGLVVDVLDGDEVVGRLVLTEGELRQQVEAALAAKRR